MATTKRTRKAAVERSEIGSRRPVGLPRVERRYTYTPRAFYPNPFDVDAIAEHSDAVRSAEHLASLGLPPPDAKPTPPGFRVLAVMPDLETPHKVWEHFSDEYTLLGDEVVEAVDEGEQAAYVAEQAAKRRRDIAADFNLQLRLMKLAETPGFVVDVMSDNRDVKSSSYVLTSELQSVDPATYDVVFIDADDRQAMALARCGAKRVVLVGDCKNQPHAVAPTLTALYAVVDEELALRRRQLGFDWAVQVPQTPLLGEDAAVDEAVLRLST